MSPKVQINRTEIVTVRMTPLMLSMLDDCRGATPRSKWVLEAIAQRVTAEYTGGPEVINPPWGPPEHTGPGQVTQTLATSTTSVLPPATIIHNSGGQQYKVLNEVAIAKSGIGEYELEQYLVMPDGEVKGPVKVPASAPVGLHKAIQCWCKKGWHTTAELTSLNGVNLEAAKQVPCQHGVPGADYCGLCGEVGKDIDPEPEPPLMAPDPPPVPKPSPVAEQVLEAITDIPPEGVKLKLFSDPVPKLKPKFKSAPPEFQYHAPTVSHYEPEIETLYHNAPPWEQGKSGVKFHIPSGDLPPIAKIVADTHKPEPEPAEPIEPDEQWCAQCGKVMPVIHLHMGPLKPKAEPEPKPKAEQVWDSFTCSYVDAEPD